MYVSQDEGASWTRADTIPESDASMVIEHPFDNKYVSPQVVPHEIIAKNHHRPSSLPVAQIITELPTEAKHGNVSRCPFHPLLSASRFPSTRTLKSMGTFCTKVLPASQLVAGAVSVMMRYVACAQVC